jgi:hypothetical protein
MNLLTQDRAFSWWPTFEVAKFNPDITREVTEALGFEPTLADFERLGIAPDDIVYGEGNSLVTEGLNRIANLIVGSGQAFSVSNSLIGVGNSADTLATTPAMTDLQGASKYFMTTSGAPSVSGAVITAAATFAGGVANFAWGEWCWMITNAAAAAGTTKPAHTVMLNRKNQALGTKASGASWTLTTTITLS